MRKVLNNKSKFTERLLEIIGQDKPYAWALRHGIAKSSIHNILKTGRPPGAEQLLKISQAANITVDWLLTGHESIFDIPKEKGTDETSDTSIINIPIIYSKTSASERFIKRDYNTLPFSQMWLEELTETTDELAVVIQCGDSMEPTIVEGDFLLVDTSVDKVTHDSIYAINSDNIYNARRLQKNLDNSLVIRCDNNRYGEQILAGEKVGKLEIIGKILMIFHKI